MSGWNDSDVNTLRRIICDFKLLEKQMYGKNLERGLCTQKWHALAHIPEGNISTEEME